MSTARSHELADSRGTGQHGGSMSIECWMHVACRQQWQRPQLPQHTMMSSLLVIRWHEP